MASDDLPTATIYENKANGQQSLSLPADADLEPGMTGIVLEASSAYDDLPDELQAHDQLRAALTLLRAARDSLVDTEKYDVDETYYTESSTLNNLASIVETIADDIHFRYEADEPIPREDIEEAERRRRERHTIEMDGDDDE